MASCITTLSTEVCTEVYDIDLLSKVSKVSLCAFHLVNILVSIYIHVDAVMKLCMILQYYADEGGLRDVEL